MCVSLALVIQHAMSMRHIISPFVAWLALPYFLPHYLINGTIIEEKLLNIERVFWFSLQIVSEKFRILRRIER
jgi:hypothetical protein